MPQIGASHTHSGGRILLAWTAIKGDVDLVNLLLARGKYDINHVGRIWQYCILVGVQEIFTGDAVPI